MGAPHCKQHYSICLIPTVQKLRSQSENRSGNVLIQELIRAHGHHHPGCQRLLKWGEKEKWGNILGQVFSKLFFPTCQVRVVRFYVSCLVLLVLLLLLLVLLLSLSSSSSCSTATRDPQCSLSDLHHDHPRPVCPAGPQPRPSTPSVPCRTSTTTIHAQCSLPDLNHDHPRPVFPAGPQPRPSPPSVPCRTSTASIHAKCSLPDLM